MKKVAFLLLWIVLFLQAKAAPGTIAPRVSTVFSPPAILASLQPPDGLWRSSLLDPVSYPLQETSGSGFYSFALAWGVNRGIRVRETKRITLETGSNLNRIETLMDWDWSAPEGLPFVVGIVKREGGGWLEYNEEKSWMAYWEPEQAPNGTIGCGVVMTSPAKLTETKEHAFLQTTIHRGVPIVHFASAGWTKSGDFPDQAAWVKYVRAYAGKLGQTQSRR